MNYLITIGAATIIWDEEEITAVPGAERLVSFNIKRAVETQHALPWRWQFESYSPANPKYDPQ